MHGALRHPVALYESAAELMLAALLWRARGRVQRPGALFKAYLLGYSCLRFGLEPLRDDGALRWGPLSSVQWVCLASAVALLFALGWPRRSVALEGAHP